MNGNRPAEGAFDHDLAIFAQVVWHTLTAPVRWVAAFFAKPAKRSGAQRKTKAQRRPPARRTQRRPRRARNRRTAVAAVRGAGRGARTAGRVIRDHTDRLYDPGLMAPGYRPPPRIPGTAHQPRTAPAARPRTKRKQDTPMPTGTQTQTEGRPTGDAVNYETTEGEIAELGKTAAATQAAVEQLSGSLQAAIGNDADTLGALAAAQEAADQLVAAAKDLGDKFRRNHEQVQEAHLASTGASQVPGFYA
jgi:hypothetical protein